MRKIKNRKIGDILLDLEEIIDEMDEAGLQLGDVLALVKSHIEIHNPSMVEEYTDGTRPIYYYGPEKG